MDKSKVVSTPLAVHLKLSVKQCTSIQEKKQDMQKYPYASATSSLMYAMVCTTTDIAHAVGVLSPILFLIQKRTLGCCEVDFEISPWYFWFETLFWQREAYSRWLYRFRYYWRCFFKKAYFQLFD
jgi:hypothetical protein